MARYLEPPLTTVHMPLDEMAATAVECLLRVVRGEKPRSVVVRTPPAIVERESTCPPVDSGANAP
jgi:DNA-binding LacI/PurR family transcriptional regulator